MRFRWRKLTARSSCLANGSNPSKAGAISGFGGQQIGLLTAHQVLDCGEPKPPGNELPVVVLGDRTTRYGLVVDRFLGERELVVQPLDSRLGKVRNISAAALMEDGSPVLIVDMEDMVRSIEKLIASRRAGKRRAHEAIRPAGKTTQANPGGG